MKQPLSTQVLDQQDFHVDICSDGQVADASSTAPFTQARAEGIQSLSIGSQQSGRHGDLAIGSGLKIPQANISGQATGSGVEFVGRQNLHTEHVISPAGDVPQTCVIPIRLQKIRENDQNTSASTAQCDGSHRLLQPTGLT